MGTASLDPVGSTVGAVGDREGATYTWRDLFGGPVHRRRSITVAAALIAAVGAVFAAVYISSVHLPDLTRDPAVVASDRWYIGTISIVGVAVWMSGSTVALVTSRVLTTSARLPLAWFGIMGIVLAVDDAMLLHEDVITQHLGYGAEIVVYFLYAVAAFVGVYLARRQIFEAGSLMFLIGAACMAMSILSDMVDLRTEIEDGFKAVGIVCWTGGLIERSITELRRVLSGSEGSRARGGRESGLDGPEVDASTTHSRRAQP